MLKCIFAFAAERRFDFYRETVFRTAEEEVALRIISGKKRGYKLTPPDGVGTRPTTDRVKESVFNIIQMRFPCTAVLDLFGGSGALGIEALSRGAEVAVFAEKDKNALRVIRKNLEGSGLDSGAMVFPVDAFEFLNGLERGSVLDGKYKAAFEKAGGFDVIFLDPPYSKGILTRALDKIFDLDILSENGIIVAETEVGGEDVSDCGFDIKKTAKYGKTIITVMQR